MKKISERIFNELMEQEKTQTELAKALDIPISTVNGWITKERTPDVQYLEKICKFLNCDLYWLLDIKNIPYLTQLSDVERDIIHTYREIDEKGKIRLEERAVTLLEEFKENR